MEAVSTSETSVNNIFTRQYIPEDNSEHHSWNGSATYTEWKERENQSSLWRPRLREENKGEYKE
jgi:hypothetical protein